VAVGGLVPAATKAKSVEAALVGKALDEATMAAAAEAVKNDLGDDLIGDIHASAEYRRAMAPVFVKRAIMAAAQRAK
jgi:carbon-monoxide dehydrogenase medium subunit